MNTFLFLSMLESLSEEEHNDSVTSRYAYDPAVPEHTNSLAYRHEQPTTDCASELDRSNPVDRVPPIEALQAILEENFQELADVTFDKSNRTFTFHFKGSIMAAIIAYGMDPENSSLRPCWTTLRKHFASLSNSIKENFGTGIQVYLSNPLNKENTLIAFIDGVVFYDAFESFNPHL